MTAFARLSVEDWNRLNRLLEAGLALDLANRSGWLETLPPESAHLQPLLEKLLAESQVTGFADDLTPPTSVVRMASDAITAMRTEQPGDRIGPWRLDRLLGEGGMGSVWLAQRADGVMQRTAALKLPRAEWVDRGLTERIARERAILARLQHPNIAVLYDAGLGADGRPFLALECVDGTPMDAHCRSVDLRQVVRLFVLVARAVAYAHSRLVIHRDLKFSNVLITADGVPKLLDFGISKLIEGETAGEATALTRLAGRPLTLAYAAPEQVLDQPVTVAADVYSLGVMLFELLTGGRLYTATTAHALEAEVVRGDLRRPSDAVADKARARALRGDLDAIVQTALKRNPEQRYQSATELADDLERYLNSKPVRAQADSVVYRVRKFAARNLVAVVAGGAVALALTIGLAVALWQAHQAQLQAAEARLQTQRATDLNTFVLSLIQQGSPSITQGSTEFERQMLASIEERIEREFKGGPEQLLQLRVVLAEAYLNRGQSEYSRLVFNRAIEQARATLPADNYWLLRARAGGAHFRHGDSQRFAELDEVIDRLRARHARGEPAAEPLVTALLARVLTLSGFRLATPAMWPAMLKDAQDAYDIALTLGKGNYYQIYAVAVLAGRTALGDGSPATAPQRLAKVIALLEGAAADARALPGVRPAHFELAMVDGTRGSIICASDPQRGLSILREVLANVEAGHTDDALVVYASRERLADCLGRAGNHAQALDLYRRTWRSIESQPGISRVYLSGAAASMVGLSLNRGSVAESREFAAKAYEHAHAMPPGKLRDQQAGFVFSGYVQALRLAGELEQAEQLVLQALDNPFCCESTLRNALAEAQRDDGRYEDARRTAQGMEAACRKEEMNPRCLMVWHQTLAAVELDAGEPAAALETLQRVLKYVRRFDDDRRSAEFGLAYGRALLATGQPAEALAALQTVHGFWQEIDRQSFRAGEVQYWYAKALIANRDRRGGALLAEAQKALADSPLKSHRALAARRAS